MTSWLLKQSNDKVKKKLDFNGIPIDLEWLSGETREYKNDNYKTPMTSNYGYIRGTDSVDGEEIDVYVKADSMEPTVFIIIQCRIDSGEFDELKYMLGFDSEEEAKTTYLTMNDPKMFGYIFPLDWNIFTKKHI